MNTSTNLIVSAYTREIKSGFSTDVLNDYGGLSKALEDRSANRVESNTVRDSHKRRSVLKLAFSRHVTCLAYAFSLLNAISAQSS